MQNLSCSHVQRQDMMRSGCFALGLFIIIRQHIEWTPQNKAATGQQPNCRDGTTKDYWSLPWHGKPVGHLLSCLSSRRFLGKQSNFAIPRRWHAQASRLWPSSKKESQLYKHMNAYDMYTYKPTECEKVLIYVDIWYQRKLSWETSKFADF